MNPEADGEVRAMREEHDRMCEVAFLGNAGSGKTVVAALLVDCMATYWSGGNQIVGPVIMRGERRINDAINDLMNHKYPPAAKEGDPPTMIRINGSRGPSGSGSITLHGVQGGGLVKRIADSEDEGSIWDLVRGEGQEHLLFAKKYVIAVDCSEMGVWDTDGGGLAAALERIGDVRGYVYGCQAKIDVPVAVLITKTDTLPDDMQHQPVEGILKRYQKLLGSLDRSCNMENIEYFKSCIDTDKRGGAERFEDGDRRLGSGDRVIRDPFTYNTGEYSRLVSWILNEWGDSAGHN